MSSHVDESSTSPLTFSCVFMSRMSPSWTSSGSIFIVMCVAFIDVIVSCHAMDISVELVVVFCYRRRRRLHLHRRVFSCHRRRHRLRRLCVVFVIGIAVNVVFVCFYVIDVASMDVIFCFHHHRRRQRRRRALSLSSTWLLSSSSSVVIFIDDGVIDVVLCCCHD